MGGRSSTPVSSGNLSDLTGSGKTTRDIAITGLTGAGKSSLVNALRGLSDFDDEAAKTDVIEGTTEPVGYPHPTFPNVTIWDLPGIGTSNFKAKEYLERVNYSQYDFFIIVASNRFTVYDIQLSQAIQKMKKQFCYVWSKMDISIKNAKLHPDFSEEGALQKVRKYCLDNLEKAGISSPEIFLVSSWFEEKYDFPLLQRTLERHILRPADKSTKPSKESGIRFIFLQKILKIDLSKLRDALMHRNLEEVAEEIRQELDELQNAKLDIAITGVSGAGKSSLVNALRGMADCEEDAAEVGITQTTMECQAYPHPSFPNVTIWDLPGIGTPEFRPKDYLEKVHFSQYDFFMIVGSERFTENDVLLAQEIKKMKKKFYFVRSKMDDSMSAESRDPNFDMDESIQKIRKHCYQELIKAGETNPRVFLISRRDLSMYDFQDLQETLENDLDDLKKHALILAMPIFSRKILEKKMAAMHALIWKLAIVSCVIGVIPVPGLSLACDLGILVSALLRFYKVFGLDEESLRRVAKVFGKDYQVLKSAIKKSPMSSEITRKFVAGLLARSLLWATVTVIELVLDFVPVLGSLFGGVSSFVTIFFMLRSFLKDIVEDAENVRAKATEP
ncbi:UNVERIFIED_CONTAM: hypothetical protein K2H54_025392 [Gekko kuhli]